MEKSEQQLHNARLAQIAEASSRDTPARMRWGDPPPADPMVETAASGRKITPGHIAMRSTVELQDYTPEL